MYRTTIGGDWKGGRFLEWSFHSHWARLRGSHKGRGGRPAAQGQDAKGRTWASCSHCPYACASSIPSGIVGGQPPGQLCFDNIQIVRKPTFSKKRERQSRACVYSSTTPRIIFYFLSPFIVFFLFLVFPWRIAYLLLPWYEDYDVIGLPGHEIQETAHRPNLSPASLMLTKRHRKWPKKGKPLLYYVYFASKSMLHPTDERVPS